MSSIRNDVINRFARSKLGGLWFLVNPLAQVLIFSLVLSNVLGAKLPGVNGQCAYAVYLCAGLLCWNLMSEIITRNLNLFIDQGNLMKKVNFPRSTLPTIIVGSCMFNNIMLLLSMMLVFVVLGHPLTLAVFWLIPLTLLTVVFAVGLGLILGIMNVFIRDIGYVTPIMLQLWFWFTPIVYPEKIIPVRFIDLIWLNPIYPLVKAYQQILVYGVSPQLDGMIVMTFLSALFIAFGFFLFRRANAEIMDVL